MLVNVTQAEESRVAIVDDGRLEWIEIEAGGREKLKGNIYKGVVETVNSSLQAAFVRFGGPRAGFLPLDEVNFLNLPSRRRDESRGTPPTRGSRARISDYLHPGQEIMVQIVREEFGTKPPTLSTFWSLAGRFLVLLPGTEAGGVSRKIEDDAGRDRLRRILKELQPPEGMGVIVRTAGLGQTKAELTRDMRYLTRLWTRIDAAGRKARAPALIFQERDLVLRVLRDLYSPDITEVLVDDEKVHAEAVTYVQSMMPGKQRLVKLYTGDEPLFARYNLEEQIESIYKRRVPLTSGGAIVIDETEALTSIDVNSGKTRESSIEETASRTNLEAATELARQIRLRDIGGLIVIDFIDMRSPANIRAVEKRLKDALKGDKARSDMTRISKLGLLEMSRQRLRATTMSSSYTACAECEGTGVIKTVESAALSLLRRIQTRLARVELARLRVTLPTDIATYLLNRKREELLRLEQRYGTEIRIAARFDMHAHEVQVETEARVLDVDDRTGRKGLEPRVKHPELEGGQGGARVAEEEEDQATGEEPDAPSRVAPPAAASENGRERRGRGRGGRGRGRSRRASSATPASGAEPHVPPDLVPEVAAEEEVRHAFPVPEEASLFHRRSPGHVGRAAGRQATAAWRTSPDRRAARGPAGRARWRAVPPRSGRPPAAGRGGLRRRELHRRGTPAAAADARWSRASRPGRSRRGRARRRDVGWRGAEAGWAPRRGVRTGRSAAR